MKIKTLAFLLACTAASVAQAEYTLEGIGVATPGFYCRKWCLGDNGEFAVFPENFEINSIADARRNLDVGLVVYPSSLFDNGGVYHQVTACYTIEEKGQFDYEGGGGTEGGYAGGRWEHSGGTYFTLEGTISVPSAGKWTLCLGARDGSYIGLRMEVGGTTNEWTKVCGYLDEDLIVVFDFPEAGYYPVIIDQYRAQSATWLEFSAVSGEYDALSTDAFSLVGDSLTTYTITFDSDGGSEVETVNRRGNRKVPRPADPRKAGFQFDGWLLDGEPYDFDRIITSDLELVAKWVVNKVPVVESVTCSEEHPKFTGSALKLTLASVVTDGDKEPLAYNWSVVEPAPSAYLFSDPTNAETDVTLYGAGEWTFAIAVSDGHDTVTGTVSVVVAQGAVETPCFYVGAEVSEKPVEYGGQVQGQFQNPPLDEFPWGAAYATNSAGVYVSNGFKVSWRSTNEVTDASRTVARKELLLDDKRPNAYGLDGYHFGGRCYNGDGTTSDNPSSGVVSTDGLVVSNVTDYISEITFSNVEVGKEPCIYWIDDPRLPISGDVQDFRPGVLTVNGPQNTLITFARIKFNSHAAAHPRIRLAILSGYGDGFKPKEFKVGNANANWAGCNEGYGHLTWAFYDIVNARPGGNVELALKGSNTFGWTSYRIEGLAFDSELHPVGLKIVIR